MNTPTDPSFDPDRHLEDSIDLFELFSRFVIEWRRFVLAAFILFVLGFVAIWAIKPLYEANATLLPQAREDSNNLASFFSGRSPGDVFLGLLASRSVQDEVVDRANLLNLYHTTNREAARGMLAARSVFTIGKDTLVDIRVRDGDADAAQRIANAYLEALEEQRQHMLQHESDIHNRFFEQQLTRESEALSTAEQDLKKTQESTGIVQLDTQTNLGISAIAGVRAQITSVRVQLASVLLGASEENPQVKQLRAQIAQLESQEHSLESAAPGGAGAAAGAKGMPGLNLDYARRLRQVRYHEALFNSISNQYEVAKLSEGYSGAPFVVIDRAIVPAGKAWPPRRLLLLVDFVFSLFAALCYVALLFVWRKLKSDPAQQPRLAAMRNSFRFR